MLNACLLQQCLFFFDDVQQFKPVVIGVKNHAGMRVEGQQNSFSFRLSSYILHLSDNSLVSKVNTVKRACRENRSVNTVKLIQAVVDLQIAGKSGSGHKYRRMTKWLKIFAVSWKTNLV
jgi:hypothetical protein